jgi:CBS domain-containing protein
MPTLSQPRISLDATTTADLMSPDVHLLPHSPSFQEAVAFLIHLRACSKEPAANVATAADLMTPVVISAVEHKPAADVIQDMLHPHVHHLFVTDAEGRITGVVNTWDVLSHLRSGA